MKKIILIILIFTIFLSGCSKSKQKSFDEEVLNYTVQAQVISPSPKPLPSPTPLPLPTPSPAPVTLVFIDPGHGGNDPGASGFGFEEKNITLNIAKKLQLLLEKSNLSTYMTRKEDVFMDHKERIQLANSKKANLYVSIHCDWYTNPSLGGTQTLYYPSKDLKYLNLNEIEFAQIIQSELLKEMQTNNRGIVDRPNLAVLRQATMPSVLIELGFLSNRDDAMRLGNNDFQQKVANGLNNGILKALEKAKN